MTNTMFYNLEKLKGRENFDTWKRLAKSCLVIEGCWKLIEEEAKPSEKEADERALAKITMMVEPYNFAHIANAKNAKQAWDALEAAFDDKGLTRQVELLKQLVNLRLENCDSMNDYVNQMVMMHIKVQKVGYGINEKFIASLMLAGLPSEFKSLVLAVENSGSQITIDSVKTLLLQDAKFDEKTNESALYTKNKNNSAVMHASKLVILLETVQTKTINITNFRTTTNLENPSIKAIQQKRILVYYMHH